ncbi:hypothetical protein [Bacillus sp. CDB3]|uniref:hypothetical protein n=1 Tax=Bacillus sp. CDB3 TaxID=360310 RepID=UPI0009D8F130|nr:hypothetical protein [Bacillus sp. CDB3]OQR58321.1 hypothetical protein CDB3_03275 [Bacillus sp. CDB3]
MKKFKFYKFSGWLWSVFALVDIANMFVTKIGVLFQKCLWILHLQVYVFTLIHWKKSMNHLSKPFSVKTKSDFKSNTHGGNES